MTSVRSEHGERLLGIARLTSVPRSVVQDLDGWRDTLREAWRPTGLEPLA